MKKNIIDFWEIENPTEKQLNYIRAIERRLSVFFVGKTKQDASKFISEYKGKFEASFINFDECKEERKFRQIAEEQEKTWKEKHKNKYWEINPYEYEFDPFGDGWGGSR